jgi:hypothetical protein
MQQQQGIQSPTLGMGLAQDQLNSTGSVVLQGGPGDMLMANPQGYQYQQQAMPLQQQPLMPMQQPQEQQELLQPHPELIQPQQPIMDVLDSSHLQLQQQQQPMMMQQPQVKQEPVTMGMPHPVTTASGAYLAQQQQQQQQPMQHQQMLLPQDQPYLGQDAAAAAAGLMPSPPPVQMVHMQQQSMMQQPAEAVQQQQPQLVQHQQPQQQQQQMLPPAPVQPPPPAPSQLQPAPLTGQISSSLFDDIDNMSAAAAGAASSSSAAAAQPENTRAPSPPPLPADFPQASGMGTLFNFSQFSQKLPAAQGPSQQMAMMPRGMEQELPPSMDELWTPEATYDHHSDGDLMQLLFGAPEQPPTMATIHLHHFLEDDACSSPLLTGLIGGSMDDLRAAEAKAGAAAAGGGSGVVAHAISAAGPNVQPAAAAAAAAAAPADGKTAVHASTAGMMLPPAAVPLEPQQHGMHQYQHHPQQQQQQQGLLAPKLEQQQQLQPGVNGVIHSQCGASATIQVQVHMQMHSGDAAGSTAAGMVQIKGEDGCMMVSAAAALVHVQIARTSLAKGLACQKILFCRCMGCLLLRALWFSTIQLACAIAPHALPLVKLLLGTSADGMSCVPAAVWCSNVLCCAAKGSAKHARGSGKQGHLTQQQHGPRRSALLRSCCPACCTDRPLGDGCCLLAALCDVVGSKSSWCRALEVAWGGRQYGLVGAAWGLVGCWQAGQPSGCSKLCCARGALLLSVWAVRRVLLASIGASKCGSGCTRYVCAVHVLS